MSCASGGVRWFGYVLVVQMGVVKPMPWLPSPIGYPETGGHPPSTIGELCHWVYHISWVCLIVFLKFETTKRYQKHLICGYPILRNHQMCTKNWGHHHFPKCLSWIAELSKTLPLDQNYVLWTSTGLLMIHLGDSVWLTRFSWFSISVLFWYLPILFKFLHFLFGSSLFLCQFRWS
jgi:hypothetical protein